VNTRNTLSLALAGIAIQTALAAPAVAADAWELTLTPYVWAVGIDGDMQIHGQDLESSMDFADIVDNLDMSGELLFEAVKGNWASYAQYDYLALDSGDVQTRVAGVDADLELKSTLATAATGYRFRTGERSTIDLMLGVRYMRMDVDFELQALGGGRNSSNNVYDGIIALRPRLSLTKYWFFSPTMSVGAGDSDLTWELSPQFVYDNCGTEIRFGYRTLNYDFEKGDDSVDLNTHGPMIGVGFRF
jgi:hypothetical protein